MMDIWPDIPITRRLKVHMVQQGEEPAIYSSRQFREIVLWLIGQEQTTVRLRMSKTTACIIQIGRLEQVPAQVAHAPDAP